jgi:hypothetical protein
MEREKAQPPQVGDYSQIPVTGQREQARPQKAMNQVRHHIEDGESAASVHAVLAPTPQGANLVQVGASADLGPILFEYILVDLDRARVQTIAT